MAASPSPEHIGLMLARLGLPEAVVLCVYQYGSRVCGTATAESDWDFTIVVDDSFDPTSPDMYLFVALQGRTLVVDNIDANVHHRSHFAELIKYHDMRALTCLWLPPEHVWRQSVDFAALFRLDLGLLRNPVSTISSKAFGYASICFREGHIKKAKKNLVHSIRYLLYGIQIAERGRIEDFSAGNEFYHQLVDASDKEEGKGDKECGERWWEEVRDEYKRIGKAIHVRFDQLLPPKVKPPRRPRRRKGKGRDKNNEPQRPRAEADSGEADQGEVAEAHQSNSSHNQVLYYMVRSMANRPDE